MGRRGGRLRIPPPRQLHAFICVRRFLFVQSRVSGRLRYGKYICQVPLFAFSFERERVSWLNRFCSGSRLSRSPAVIGALCFLDASIYPDALSRLPSISVSSLVVDFNQGFCCTILR